MRGIHCVLGQLSRVDGSAQFTQGQVSVLGGVYGPVDVKAYEEKLDRAYIEVKFRPDLGPPTTKDKWVESNIRNAFERIILAQLHPRTMIQISLQVRDSDGPVEATAINATTLALVDAGVPMSHMVAAAACAVSAQGQVLVDPVQEEVDSARSVHTLAFAFRGNGKTPEPVYVDSRGEFSLEDYGSCFDQCLRTASHVLSFMRTAVVGKVEKESSLMTK